MEAEEAPKAFADLGKQIQMYMKLVGAYKAKVSARPRVGVLSGEPGSGLMGWFCTQTKCLFSC